MITVIQRPDEAAAVDTLSGSGQSRESITSWQVIGTYNEAEARRELEARIPLMRNGLEFSGYTIRSGETDIWEADVKHSLPQQTSSDNPFTFASFSTTGGTRHISHSWQTIRRGVDASPGTVTDFGGAIGVTDDSIEGTDVPYPKFEFTLNRVRNAKTITLAYIKLLARSTGKINAYAWLTFDPGELMFMGAEGSQNTKGEFSLSYRFAASENATNLVVGSLANSEERITIPQKRGWDYLWIHYAPKLDGASKRMARKPVGAYLERVAWDMDFSLLGVY